MGEVGRREVRGEVGRRKVMGDVGRREVREEDAKILLYHALVCVSQQLI